MKNRLLFLFLLLIVVLSCSENGQDIISEPGLSEYEIDVIDYFKEISLGFEFGNASKVTRKWSSEMKVFIGGDSNSELLSELDKITTEMNEIMTDGFKVTFVNDSLESNYYIYFGTGAMYAEMFPAESNLVNSNFGLFSVFWNGQNQLFSGRMYVDISRANSIEQKHLLREEFTQSMGLAKDSSLYPESIFQSVWTTTTAYAPIDLELIRLLYHPKMSTGLNETEVDEVLKEILISDDSF